MSGIDPQQFKEAQRKSWDSVAHGWQGQRASSLVLQDVIEFREGDAETISLPSSTFDAVVCRWGLMFLPDLRVGLSNIYRSLVEGGQLAAAVWASPEKFSHEHRK